MFTDTNGEHKNNPAILRNPTEQQTEQSVDNSAIGLKLSIHIVSMIIAACSLLRWKLSTRV